MSDPNRLSWPPTRSDILGLVAIGVIADALANEAWGLAGSTLLICAFAAAFPRMTGRFKVGPKELEGEVVPPAGVPTLEGEVEG